jgi:hypothetical protein
MFALQINRHSTAHLSPKEALRTHVDQLSPAQQREFIAAALQLIATRAMMDEAEAIADYLQPVHHTMNAAIH